MPSSHHPAPWSTPGVPRYCSWAILVPLNQGQSDLNSESERLPGLIREYLQPLCSQLDSQVTVAAGDPDTGVKVACGGAGGGRGAATSRGQQLDMAWPGNLVAQHPREAHRVAHGDPIADVVRVLVPAFSLATVGLPVHHQGAPTSAQSRVLQPSETLHLQLSQHRVPPVCPSQYSVPPTQHPSSAQHGHVSAQYKTLHSLPRCTGHPQPPACTLSPPFPAEHPLFPVPRWELAVPGPVGSLLPRSRRVTCTGTGVQCWLHTCPHTGRHGWAGRAWLHMHVPPRMCPTPGAGAGPGDSPLEAVSCFSPKPRGPGSSAKPLPWVVGEVTCPPCLSFPSDTQHVPRMAGQSVCPP